MKYDFQMGSGSITYTYQVSLELFKAFKS
jgi:hypothetical protein